MIKFGLHITLIDDVVISERAATAGGHKSLDYIPGANLLGAVASTLYAELDEDQAYIVFHSGQIRFGNALPLSQSLTPAYPMPLCWHEKKTPIVGEESINSESKRLNPNHIFNFQHTTELEGGNQPKQMRTGYVSFDGSTAKPKLNLRMKTAIDPSTARAQSSQLFGYNSIPAGTPLFAEIHTDIEDEALLQKIKNTLNGELRLGRARTAEYGRVSITILENKPDHYASARNGSINSDTLTLWLISDLALQDKHGRPSLNPTAAQLGLPEFAKLDQSKTFIRTRSYAPFNGKTRFRELERLVISQGSVLHFNLGENILTEQQISTLQSGLGLYRQAGLGQVIINPSLLSGKIQLSENLSPVAQAQETQPPKQPEHTLIDWLQNRVSSGSNRKKDRATAYEWAKELSKLYQSAHRLAGETKGIVVGPSATQWGRILTAAKDPRKDPQQLKDAIADICKGNEWSQQVMLDGELSKFNTWLNSLIDTQTSLPYILSTLARCAQNIVKQQQEASA